MSYPIKFIPIYKEKVWGGSNLKDCLNKDIRDNKSIGESWEICAHKEGTSIVSNGEFKGKNIIELMKEQREKIFGIDHNNWNNYFPLLIKFIDANDKLSVQVHPDDEYALQHENEFGKTEMWYIVDAKSDAKLIYGLKRDVSKKDFIEAIKENNSESTLNEVSVKKGDVLFIPSGILHAIGEGIALAEIQQNSDTTYRVYDWKRLGLDGKPRELHIEKALDVIDFNKRTEFPLVQGLTIEEDGLKRTIYVSCKYFTTEVLDIGENYRESLNGDRFEILMCVNGEFDIVYNNGNIERFKKGETVLVPANIGEFAIVGKGVIIKTYIMENKELVRYLLDVGFTREDIKKIEGID